MAYSTTIPPHHVYRFPEEYDTDDYPELYDSPFSITDFDRMTRPEVPSTFSLRLTNARQNIGGDTLTGLLGRLSQEARESRPDIDFHTAFEAADMDAADSIDANSAMGYGQIPATLQRVLLAHNPTNIWPIQLVKSTVQPHSFYLSIYPVSEGRSRMVFTLTAELTPCLLADNELRPIIKPMKLPSRYTITFNGQAALDKAINDAIAAPMVPHSHDCGIAEMGAEVANWVDATMREFIVRFFYNRAVIFRLREERRVLMGWGARVERDEQAAAQRAVRGSTKGQLPERLREEERVAIGSRVLERVAS